MLDLVFVLDTFSSTFLVGKGIRHEHLMHNFHSGPIHPQQRHGYHHVHLNFFARNGATELKPNELRHDETSAVGATYNQQLLKNLASMLYDSDPHLHQRVD
jgi:hypothetical protein